MIPLVIQQCLVGLYVLTTTSMVGWIDSPMSWSPDGEWLGYTVVADSSQDDLAPGWLFETAVRGDATRGTRAVGDRNAPAASKIYQIWASHGNHEPSVLVEEARWPLTAPSWSPRGKSIAFGRFVPQSMEPNQPGQRGRFEVVIQDAMNRKRVLWASSDFELDDDTRTRFPQLAVAWSPDGRYLAISRPGSEPSILIMGTDSGKVLATLEQAAQPVWSPDGSQCAFIRIKNDSINLCLVERHGQTFGPSRQFIVTGSVRSTPGWSNDSRSIFVVTEKSTNRSRELVLDRLSTRNGDSARVLNLVSEPGLRTGSILGVAIDFDRDGERCFFSVNIDGRENDLGLGILRDQHIPKRFHPDRSKFANRCNGALPRTTITSPSDSEPPGSLSPPAFVRSADSTRPARSSPDETSRRQWLNVLIAAHHVAC